MDTCKRAMDNLDLLSDFRLILLLDHTDPLLKGWVTQHTELHHLSTGDLHRMVCIPVSQNVKRRGALCQQRTELTHGHFKLDKHIIVDNGKQNPTGFRIVADLFLHIPHGYKTSQAFPSQKVTHN